MNGPFSSPGGCGVNPLNGDLQRSLRFSLPGARHDAARPALSALSNNLASGDHVLRVRNH